MRTVVSGRLLREWLGIWDVPILGTTRLTVFGGGGWAGRAGGGWEACDDDSWLGLTWLRKRWNYGRFGLLWAGPDWPGLAWVGPCWTGVARAGPDWPGLARVGLGRPRPARAGP